MSSGRMKAVKKKKEKKRQTTALICVGIKGRKTAVCKLCCKHILEGRHLLRREGVKVTAPPATGPHQFCRRLSGVDRAKCKHMSHNHCYFHLGVELNCITV